MFESAQLGKVALATALVSAVAAVAPRAGAQARPHQDFELPTTPPPLEASDPLYEREPPKPRGSAGLALVTVLVGPLGLALAGLAAVTSGGEVALPFTPTPRNRSLQPASQRRGPEEPVPEE